ncbi:HEAT repeat domain-containing protein [Microcoleus sp. bin38.metabat.b11b12b14.051]|uniref:HEAT repeat domain-containing protein n=1 Tax=Microcoleus sp. bin38.metabat.b11b12b14.051 TaxID=2742709 RepID=UPI0025D5BC01|nr:HEAT repeat domain-containing protein [Microcoleus sp. bin38.metabat.b11b12b14.051]
MDKRFINLVDLTEQQAIAILETPADKLADPYYRYIAASHLVNFSTEQSIAALMVALENTEDRPENQAVRRKAAEILGRLQAAPALTSLHSCLQGDDFYVVENAVWAIGEIGTKNVDILEDIAKLLDKPGQSYRVIIRALAKLNYTAALSQIRQFVDSEDEMIRSAAVTTVCRFSGDYSQMSRVVMLQSVNVNARRSSIQDLIDAKYYQAIPLIARCPVSLVFRLRAVRMLANAGIPAGEIAFAEIEPILDRIIGDRPDDLDLVYEYDQLPSLEFAINELYEIDGGRCYLASKTLLESYKDEAPDALLAIYEKSAYKDSSAHYHVIKLLGWLKYAPAFDLLIESLHNQEPQFQKSRTAAAIALGEIGDKRAIAELKVCLKTRLWDLKYGSLMVLAKLGDNSGCEILAQDEDLLVQKKAASLKAATIL